MNSQGNNLDPWYGSYAERTAGLAASEVRALFADRKLRVAVDRVFPFAQALAAFHYVDAGHVRGKVVLDMEVAPIRS